MTVQLKHDYWQDSVFEYVRKDRTAAVIETCSKLFGETIESVIPITGGRGTSNILQITTLDKKYVCRITDTKNEAKIMEILDRTNVSPKIHHVDGNGIILMEKVENIRLTPEIIEESDHFYIDLGHRMRDFHKGPILTDKHIDMFKDLEHRLKVGKSQFIPKEAQNVLQTILAIGPVLRAHQTEAPIHRDLTSNNVLYDGKRTYLIDFETATNGDPYFDLGSIGIFLLFDPKKEALFLESYFEGEPTPEQQAHYYLMKTFCLSFWSTKRFLTVATENMKCENLPEYKEFILKRFNGCPTVPDTPIHIEVANVFLREAIKHIAAPQFAQSLAILQK